VPVSIVSPEAGKRLPITFPFG